MLYPWSCTSFWRFLEQLLQLLLHHSASQVVCLSVRLIVFGNKVVFMVLVNNQHTYAPRLLFRHYRIGTASTIKIPQVAQVDALCLLFPTSFWKLTSVERQLFNSMVLMYFYHLLTDYYLSEHLKTCYGLELGFNVVYYNLLCLCDVQ